MATTNANRMDPGTANRLHDLRARWVGRAIHGSTDTRLAGSPSAIRPITEVWVNDAGEWVALAGEHHRASSPEALERRLHSLVPVPGKTC